MRVNFDDVERIPQILKAIPAETVLRLQKNIGKVWKRSVGGGGRARAASRVALRSPAVPAHDPRFAWSSYRPFLDQWKSVQASNAELSEIEPASLPARETEWDIEQGDAFMTLMEWLHGKMR